MEKSSSSLTNTVKTGLENLISFPPQGLKGRRLGLLCNPASVDSSLNHAAYLINNFFPGQLIALYSPQHGFYAEKQDNMVESGHMTDPDLGIPVFSLYGDTRRPTKEMFDPIDVLIIDLQDAGTRVYTFIYTVSYCLEVAKELGIRVIILDRPNPVNGVDVEGNCIKTGYTSFVGRYPIPMRHGLTMGELAMLINSRFKIGADMKVLPMTGWRRNMLFAETGLPWIPPSPNLPTPAAAFVYPGQVLWEGTNVSEGRGTTQPFEIFGAPFLEPEGILSFIGKEKLPGVVLRKICFEPTSNKWAGKLCKGFQLHVTDPERYLPYITTLRLIQAVYRLHGGKFQWKSPPYEYEYNKLPIDLITGDPNIRRQLESMVSPDEIALSWENELKKFLKMREDFYLYD